MKGSQGNKEKRKNYNQSKRPINYVPKAHRTPDPAISTVVPAAEIEEPSKTNTQPLTEPSGKEAEKTVQPPDKNTYGNLTRAVLISLYSKKPVPSHILDSLKELKDIHSEEIITPIALTDFNMPMTKAIMPPRKNNSYEPKGVTSFKDPHKPEDEIGENDTGIVEPSDNSQQNPNEMPEWSTSSNTDKLNTKETESYADDFSKMQISLEEEKDKLFGKEKPRPNAPPAKVDIETIFKKFQDEGKYSNVDVKYEQSLKSANKTTNDPAENKVASLFSDPAIANIPEKSDSHSTENAIDITTIEKQILKGTKQEDTDMNDDVEEKPVWDTFSAEEIKQQSQSNMENWGLTLTQDKEGLVKPIDKSASVPIVQQPEPVYPKKAPIYEEPSPKPESKNPFCHSSLNIKETDRVWYYRDIQNCIQGPFTAIEMFVWHKAGYFPHDLPLKCGDYFPFITLADFLNSVKPKTRPEFMPVQMMPPIQRFDQTNMEAFFGQTGGLYGPMDASKGRGQMPMTLEEIESQYRPVPLEKARSDSNVYRPQYPAYYARPMPQYVPVPQYYQAYQAPRQLPRNYLNEDPAIASARVGGSMENGVSHPDAGYITEEANDLKALLGMPGAEKHA